MPRVRNTAIVLYKIYLGMTLLMIALLALTGMNWFHNLCITFGTAGTGGFGILNDSCASYTPIQQWIITLFMIAFGVNFGFYYLSLIFRFREALAMEEVRAYVGIIWLPGWPSPGSSGTGSTPWNRPSGPPFSRWEAS